MSSSSLPGDMSPSSSGSWSGARGADIIDLDRYMRGNVRPSRTLSDNNNRCVNERLVVDAGGARACKPRKPCSPSSSTSGDVRHKRYSHDSGVDDGSYRPRRMHRPHRRSNQGGPSIRSSQEPTTFRKLNGRATSASSLRAFRTVCEEALRDQQQQIARVTALCERLTEHAEKSVQEKSKPERSERAVKVERAPSVETSEISSSSLSTKNQRKEKDRSQECKTYKIIMNKLDDLNRVFAHRPHAAPRLAPRPRTPPSSTSVSVCDKLTATEPPRTINRVLSPTRTLPNTQGRQLSRAIASCGPASVTSRVPSVSARVPSVESRVPSVSARAHVVARACTVDISPRDAQRSLQPNVHTESIVKCESSAEGTQHSGSDPRFDLEDPVHLYAQAKRLQAFTVSTRRSHSVDAAASARTCPHAGSALAGCTHADTRAPSLCALCRAYWRCLRRYIEPLFQRAAEACDA